MLDFLRSLKIIFEKYFDENLSDISAEFAAPFVKKVYKRVLFGLENLHALGYLVPSEAKDFAFNLKCLISNVNSKKSNARLKDFLIGKIQTKRRAIFIKQLVLMVLHKFF